MKWTHNLCQTSPGQLGGQSRFEATVSIGKYHLHPRKDLRHQAAQKDLTSGSVFVGDHIQT
jgi:hypothetical protein